MRRHAKKADVTHGTGYRLLKVVSGDNTIAWIAAIRRQHGLGLRQAIAAAIWEARARRSYLRECGECGGSGKLTRLGGDWGIMPDIETRCWKCQGTKIEPPKKGTA